MVATSPHVATELYIEIDHSEHMQVYEQSGANPEGGAGLPKNLGG